MMARDPWSRIWHLLVVSLLAGALLKWEPDAVQRDATSNSINMARGCALDQAHFFAFSSSLDGRGGEWR
jgi:hypothetical protein